jgi:hypothetical protein
MFPRCQLRHYTSILFMHSDLGRDDARQYAAVLNYSYSGFIA